jgi:hypothetical protein
MKRTRPIDLTEWAMSTRKNPILFEFGKIISTNQDVAKLVIKICLSQTPNRFNIFATVSKFWLNVVTLADCNGFMKSLSVVRGLLKGHTIPIGYYGMDNVEFWEKLRKIIFRNIDNFTIISLKPTYELDSEKLEISSIFKSIGTKKRMFKEDIDGTCTLDSDELEDKAHTISKFNMHSVIIITRHSWNPFCGSILPTNEISTLLKLDTIAQIHKNVNTTSLQLVKEKKRSIDYTNYVLDFFKNRAIFPCLTLKTTENDDDELDISICSKPEDVISNYTVEITTNERGYENFGIRFEEFREILIVTEENSSTTRKISDILCHNNLEILNAFFSDEEEQRSGIDEQYDDSED